MKKLIIIVIVFVGISFGCFSFQPRDPMNGWFYVNKYNQCIPLESVPNAHPERLAQFFQCQYSRTTDIMRELKCLDAAYGQYLYYYYAYGLDVCENFIKTQRK